MSIKVPKKKKPIWEVKKDENLQLIRDAMKDSILTVEQLPELLAEAMAWEDIWEKQFNEISQFVQDYNTILTIFSQKEFKTDVKNPEYTRMKLLSMIEERGGKAAKLLLTGLKNQKSHKGREMANSKHNKPGGSREKQIKIRDIWATGKYTSRD